MTLANCKRLLEHFDKARKDDYVTGNPPTPLDDLSKANMAAAYDEMRAHIAEKYGEKELPGTKANKK